jgi:chromate reductase
MNIVILSGSPRDNSLTVRVALHLQTYLNTHYTQHNIDLVDLRQHHLPPVQTPFVSIEQTPTKWQDLATTMFNADAFILVSPEYNGGYSPTMKNLLDHFPKFSRRVFGIATASPGTMGGMRAAMQMQQMVAAFFGILVPQMLIVPTIDKKFDEKGNLIDTGFEKSVQNFIHEFMWLAEAIIQK